ncbi:hypothetical protein BDN72DRAFT_965521 [Pluteus cervinus]|uniref:Uncharacterized protein n=1 Tax=Pluteus cervinus TaxID=181527 RepID=A0ACD3A4J6_9AGAR|nr:hypothetical protein BDN72DRAFT_965521 [Pluteus cervinus]
MKEAVMIAQGNQASESRGGNVDDIGNQGGDGIINSVPSYISLMFFNFANDLASLINFIDILPLPQIRTVYLSGGSFEDQGPALINYFDDHGGTEQLTVTTSIVPTFTNTLYKQIQALRKVTGHEGDEVDAEHLDDVSVSRCRGVLSFHQLTTLTYDGEWVDEIQFHRQYYSILREWLMWRRLAGLGLKTLTFREVCIPPESYLRTLYDDVVDEFVRVGGKEMKDESMALPFLTL